MTNLKKGIYQHYKGKYYEVIDVVHHSETLEELVLYKTLYKTEMYDEGKLWVRPLKMFTERIYLEGKMIDRFKFVKEHI